MHSAPADRKTWLTFSLSSYLISAQDTHLHLAQVMFHARTAPLQYLVWGEEAGPSHLASWWIPLPASLILIASQGIRYEHSELRYSLLNSMSGIFCGYWPCGYLLKILCLLKPSWNLLLGKWLMTENYVSFPRGTLYLLLLGSYELHEHHSLLLFIMI